MQYADLDPLRDWEPEIDSVVLDARHDSRGRKGTVLRCDQYGHCADPYWRASVRWDNDWVEYGLDTCWLTREDGTQ